MSASKKILSKSLKSQLIQLIRIKGPLTVAEYMRLVLTNPASGFYMNNDVFGSKGHFTTNPEISQTFGETIGAWIVQEWRRFECPKPLRLVEFGPGRGTLMSDVVRTIGKLERTLDAVQIRLIEVSPKLRDVQNQTLSSQAKGLFDQIRWYSHLGEIDDRESTNGFTAFLAHEYLDALPIHKFVRDKSTGKWRELLIDYDKNEELRYCIATMPRLSTRLLVPENFPGDHLEVCPEAALQLEKVTQCLNATQKGCMLVCDYGFDDESTDYKQEKVESNPMLKSNSILSNRDTFRAFKNHESWHPLKDPGEADLTADVDFGYFKKHLKDKAVVYGSVTQRDFLLKCGFQHRLSFLADKASSEKECLELKSGSDLIINEMGDRYRFMSIFPKGAEPLFGDDPPAGFM